MDKKYKIDYNKKSFNYISIEEESMIPYYEKIINKIKENNLNIEQKISQDQFRNNVKQFNTYQKNIADYITRNGPDASKLYVKNLMGLNDIEANIIYQISIFTNKYFTGIEDHKIFKKNTESQEQFGGEPGKTCVTLSLMLDMAGMIPGLGMAIDAFGVAVSLFCGDFFGAFLGMISIVPVAGWATGAVEIIRNMIKMYGLFTSMTSKEEDDGEEEEEEEYDDE